MLQKRRKKLCARSLYTLLLLSHTRSSRHDAPNKKERRKRNEEKAFFPPSLPPPSSAGAAAIHNPYFLSLLLPLSPLQPMGGAYEISYSDMICSLLFPLPLPSLLVYRRRRRLRRRFESSRANGPPRRRSPVGEKEEGRRNSMMDLRGIFITEAAGGRGRVAKANVGGGEGVFGEGGDRGKEKCCSYKTFSSLLLPPSPKECAYSACPGKKERERERERETAAGLPSFLLPPPHFLCLVSSRRSGGQQGVCTACGVGEPPIAVFLPPQSAKTGCSQKPCTG